MRSTLRRFPWLCLGWLVAAASVVAAGAPPDRMHYQGVLRDASNAPLDGSFVMVFRLFDAPLAGDELLVNEPLPVDVEGGLFGVELGSGTVTDGAGPGTYGSLGEVFAVYPDVWLEIEVAGETLAPRVPVAAAAYALNAGTLAGRGDAEFLDVSATPQSKAGSLALGSLSVAGDTTLSGGSVLFGGGARLISTATTTLQTLGDADTDSLHLYAGNTVDDGALRIFGDSTFEMRSGSGLFTFVNGSTGAQSANLSGSGNFQVAGDVTVSGADLVLGTVARLQAYSGGFNLLGGVFDTDDLTLRAGNTSDDGEISILGDAEMVLRAGNGLYQLVAGDTSLALTIDQSDPVGNAWTFGGLNLDLYLGDSAADNVLVPGTLSVTGAKNFVQNHPYRDDLSVVYTALEGDEAGTYTRGTARLAGGVARIPLEPSFAWVTYPDGGLTAHLTPRGAWADLWIESLTTDELVVRGRDGGPPDAAFDYVVYGLRIGYEDASVLQERRLDGTLPAAEHWARFYAAHDDLRPFAPAERFRRMERSAGDRADAEGPSDRATALRRAIGEHDPDAETAGRVRPAAFPEGRVEPSDPVPEPGYPDAAVGPAADERPAAPAEAPTWTRQLRTRDPELAAAVEIGPGVEPGDLIVADADHPGRMVRATRAADPGIVGIVSGRPGVVLGDAGGTGSVPVAFSGIVAAKVDAGYGAVRVGDLLTSSPTPGHAMRADDPLPGTVVGKALEPLDAGTGVIRVLVMLR